MNKDDKKWLETEKRRFDLWFRYGKAVFRRVIAEEEAKEELEKLKQAMREQHKKEARFNLIFYLVVGLILLFIIALLNWPDWTMRLLDF